MSEGSLEAPTRHPIDWQNPEFYDEAKLDAELRRVFDICHGCRRCFNLCDSFPRLFDLVDAAPSEELDTVASSDFKSVVDACTLCDMCFMSKCPYVPPHSFDLDFPHLMLRYRAVEAKKGNASFIDKQLAETDRNGKLIGIVAPIANAVTATNSKFSRAVLEKVTGIDARAELPTYTTSPLTSQARATTPEINREAPGFGRKAVLYATCFNNYNDPSVGLAARGVLARNGVETEVVHPHCCGMPMLEQGHIAEVAKAAEIVAKALNEWIDKGYDVIALVPSCALMLKFEWPLILPDNAAVKKLSQATFDLSEYVVDIAKKNGMAPGMEPIAGGVSLHISCHSRAQNMGQKANEMLKLLPQADVQVIERCSGHGGAWGFKKGNFDTAKKVGRPVARTTRDGGKAFVTSECPLAGVHITQGIDALGTDKPKPQLVKHPIQLLARSYGLDF
ncbi:MULTISPECIES: heterodisulfide reductase-related iron-sulfur binding cluster [unclassified Beijerinckia]|uniref:heterodisulfide reductase-related iron-sulfur binding cluster n=1 Tax=unclassified Beijerinckia TaxID=2638183 RepID=UPI00089776BC|nr:MULTISPECIES: heterodisulfide reductase-related iron-sulfur binding cluster [unclassified Beijerinckia]MDH7795698.1 glycerol-3-phosphate dehydrogenase subunit C [Beijerinckia sp. GAS462]SEC12331.1 Fe-S oxidoreductase [Beijerinckia sp. 28-YEA-48]